MKLTDDQRELLRGYEVLSVRDREQMQVFGGLPRSIWLLRELLGLFWDLGSRLEQIDKEQQSVASQIDQHSEAIDPLCPDIATSELLAATVALEEVLRTLDKRGVNSDALERLHRGLIALANDSSPPGMLTPTESPSRPLDPPTIQAEKGMLAAALHVRQKVSGESRKEAAAWVVQHTSPELIRRLSRKPITSRTVIEWLDRFGGKHGAAGSGRDAFLFWSETFGRWNARVPFTGNDLIAVTKSHAMHLPALAA
jgi:hypothetical protein